MYVCSFVIQIGETVNDLKKSLTVELEPLSLHSISENTFKEG